MDFLALGAIVPSYFHKTLKAIQTMSPDGLNSFRAGPDETGRFGLFGGRYVAETLMPLILEVEQAYHDARKDPEFLRLMDYYLAHYVGRPSPLYFAERLTEHLGEQKFILNAMS